MTDEKLKRAIAGDDALERCFESLSVRIKDLEPEIGIRRMIEDTDITRNLMRTIPWTY